MKKVYKAHILFTKEKSRFEVIENGYVAVEDGVVTGLSEDLKSLDSLDAEVIDYGDKLLIPAMNDVHVHAPQYRNQGTGYRTILSQRNRNMPTSVMQSECIVDSFTTYGVLVPCEP